MYKNDIVIISGGLGGIGIATAKLFYELGAQIILGDIIPETDARTILISHHLTNDRCKYFQVNVSNSKEVKAWVDKSCAEIGIPNLIIVNAAITRLAGFDQISAEDWEKDIAVNVNGAFFLSKLATGKLKEENKPGKVVFVGSWAAQHVHSHMPAYSVSKAAIHMLNKCLALELAPYNILVNEIAPGYVDAGLSGRIWEENPGRKERAKERVPTKNVITAEEVAEQISFLCQPSNRHMVGSTLLMDGGLSLL